ncbi:glycosyltransferase, partial [Klebsiella pneumoniae]|uniref:glycosyltransferase n=1 Tax=Klebsiella pneumoniae TaxID=573 RepID=UPI003852246F
TFIVAAYNEAYCIREKIENTLTLEYPDDKIEFIFVTDGSTDDTPTIIKEYPRIKLLHKDGRSGKIAAVHRAMQEVKTDIVVFT